MSGEVRPLSISDEAIDYTCPRCKRKWRTPATVQGESQHGKQTRCFCGAEFTIPDEPIITQADDASSVPEWFSRAVLIPIPVGLLRQALEDGERTQEANQECILLKVYSNDFIRRTGRTEGKEYPRVKPEEVAFQVKSKG